ncbi:MAG: PAS domain S-box protein [Chloroflexi bacterium]|nr:PAS domain S-box protein [Chloroflexota bacterium]
MSEQSRKSELESTQQTIKFFETLLRASGDGIVITDVAQSIVVVNEAFCDFFERRWRDVVETSLFVWLEQLDADAPRRWAELEHHVRLDGSCRDVEFRRMMGDEERWLNVNASLLERVADEEQGIIISIWRDVTERKRMEQEMLRTERMAAMGRIAATLAHEVNNPLQAIGLNMSLLLDFPIQEKERQECLRTVRQEVNRLKMLTGRVLTFVHPTRFELELLSAVQIIHHSLTLVDERLRNNQIQIRLDLPDDLPPVLASRDQLVQVLLNLIINAIEAMPGGGELHISARLVGEQIELAFSDNGPGLSPDTLEAIFDLVYTTKEKGSGLGLIISQSIIAQHGGVITADNVPGGGTIFTITLPQAETDTCSSDA